MYIAIQLDVQQNTTPIYILNTCMYFKLDDANFIDRYF